MNVLKLLRTAGFVALMTALAMSADSQANYEKGTITNSPPSTHKSYDLKGGSSSYQIGNCAEFHDGQEVEYRVEGQSVYIRHEGGKDYKCHIEGTYRHSTAAEMGQITYQKGTIEGFETQRHYSGNNSVRKAKVYELHGPDLIYQIDYCGWLQAGKFQPGQVVDYRVDADQKRLYILHDQNKEYSCQIEGRRKTDTPAETAEPAASAATPAPAASTAKVSIASVPDGADIEIDGSFSGNTPSELELPAGEHSVTVKKSGYKDWQRKIKIAAGSSVRLSAEMEKTATP